MNWIGLTGGIASGKSTVSQHLRHLGFDVIDADQLAREAVKVGTLAHQRVVAEFGAEAVLPNGELNRKKIGEIVFASGPQGQAKLKQLEEIIHPEVRRLSLEHRSRLEREGKRYAFYDVPLLYEKAMEAMFTSVIVVACNLELQEQRLISREGFTAEEAKRRIAAQLPIEEKIVKADHVLLNNGTLDDLKHAVDLYVAQLD